MVLFSEEELRKLYDDSQVSNTALTDRERTRAREVFVSKAQRVLAAFSRDEDSPLFGREETTFPNRLAFSPLFGFIKHSVKNVPWETAFCPGAFSSWENVFLISLDQFFGALAMRVLEEQAGEMTFPSDRWCREKALPLIESGAHFRLLAQKYPLCARQLIEFAWLQAEHVKDILDAVMYELPGLYTDFFPGRAVPRVSLVSGSDSDRHNGGRSTHILTFEDGTRLVYKPHDLKMDRAFHRWIDRCAGIAGEAPFLFPVCADTERGGFCSFVEHVPLKSKADAARYFYRTGFLLGIVWLMHGNDLHCENIIAAGAEPVLIDTETLTAPEECLLGRLVPRRSLFSVADMAVLPVLLSFPGLNEAKFAGLCDILPGAHNLPEFSGETISGRAYAREISDGFARAVTAVTKDLTASARAFEEYFTGCRVRSVIRPTASYFRILTGLCHIGCQQDLSRYRHMLAQMRLEAETVTKADRDMIFREECHAFDRLDIPYFTDILTPDMLRGLTRTWAAVTEHEIGNESERIYFGLTVTDPRTGASTPLPAPAAVPDIREKALRGIRRQAALLEELLPGGSGAPCAVPSQQDDYILCTPLRDNNGILEGSLGTLVALSACCAVLGEEARPLREKLCALTGQLTDPAQVAPVLTVSDLSLCGGSAGYILGCWLCYMLGTMTEDALRQALSLLDPLAGQQNRLIYSRFEALYGSYDMIYVLSLLPETFLTDALIKVRDCLLGAMALSEEEICRRVRARIRVLDGPAAPVRNNSLRFGNAGRLMVLLTGKELSAAEAACAGDLVSVLAEAEHVLPQAVWPEGYRESGLLHGLSGVTYTLCRFLAPGSVPAL